MKKIKYFLSFIRVKTIVSLILILTAGGMIITISNLNLYRQLRTNVYQNYSATLTNTLNQYGNAADTIDTYYVSYLQNTSAIYDLKQNRNDTAYSVAKTRVRMDMENTIQLYPFSDLFYCYIENQDDFFTTASKLRYPETQQIISYILGEEYRASADNNLWNICFIEQTSYLLRSYHNGKVEIGLCIALTNLFPTPDLFEDDFLSTLYFVDEDSHVLASARYGDSDVSADNRIITQQADKNTLIQIPLGISDIQLCAVINQSNILLKNVKTTSANNLLIIIAVLGMVAIFIYSMLRIYLYKPVKSIIEATGQIVDGRLDTRLDENNPTREIAQISRQFNQVILQLTTLKISLYEEKIHYQESLLEQLRLQLNPHLLLNSLNMIYTMNRRQHHDVAQQFTLCLIKHFRYVLRKNHKLAPLNSEMEFVENYLEIMNLQYPDYFLYKIENTINPQRRASILLPPLIIQNLAENSVKYGLLQDKPLHFSIYLAEECREGHYWIRIVIQDDGGGFPSEKLAYFNALAAGGMQVNARTPDYMKVNDHTPEQMRNHANTPDCTEAYANTPDRMQNHPNTPDRMKVKTEHTGIGIRNLIIRLQLLYDGKARVHFSNDTGAIVVLEFPSVWPYENKEN